VDTRPRQSDNGSDDVVAEHFAPANWGWLMFVVKHLCSYLA
jgi:hypothetical protein